MVHQNMNLGKIYEMGESPPRHYTNRNFSGGQNSGEGAIIENHRGQKKFNDEFYNKIVELPEISIKYYGENSRKRS